MSIHADADVPPLASTVASLSMEILEFEDACTKVQSKAKFGDLIKSAVFIYEPDPCNSTVTEDMDWVGGYWEVPDECNYSKLICSHVLRSPKSFGEKRNCVGETQSVLEKLFFFFEKRKLYWRDANYVKLFGET